MPRICPRPCSRLTTAAVFIAVGVVQLLVGIILLRSKFADLISGPDFMNASSNIGIGCVYGMAASVWRNKNKKKQRSLRRTARNNVLASLLVSVITVNATVAAILIMGDGNKLLFTYLETADRKSPTAFANEVLAGAYVTSVCSPIVCVVIAIVALSGSCFQAYGNKHRNLENALDIESPFGWTPDPKSHSRPKLVRDCLAETPTTSSDQSSRFSEDSVFSEKDTRTSLPRKSSSYIPSPVNTWAHKRSHILRNSRLLQKRSKIFDTHPSKQELRQLSDQEPIPRTKESSILKKSHHSLAEHMPCCDSIRLAKEKLSKKSASVGTDLRNKTECFRGVRSGKMNDSSEVRFAKKSPVVSSDSSESSASNEDKSDVNGSTNNSFEYFTNQKPMHSANVPRNSLDASVDDLALRHAEAHLMEKINPALMKLKVETLRELKKRIQNFPSVASTSKVTTPQQPSGILKKSKRDSHTIDTFTRNFEDACSEILGNLENSLGEDKYSNESVKKKDSSAELSSTNLPLPDPMSFPDTIQNNKTQHIHDSILNGIKSTIFDFTRGKSQPTDENQRSEEVISSASPVCNDGKKKMTNLVLDCPKVPSIKLQSRKRDVAKRMSSMESITEIPSEEADSSNPDQNSAAQYNYSPSQDMESSFKRDENSNIMQEQNAAVEKATSPNTVKRRNPSTNPSIKNMLKGIWSPSTTEAKLNILELIMDEDSLIGLSEEDLINRTLRIRALRKAVSERLKSKPEKETKIETTEDPACNALSEE